MDIKKEDVVTEEYLDRKLYELKKELLFDLIGHRQAPNSHESSRYSDILDQILKINLNHIDLKLRVSLLEGKTK